jgi:cell division protein FtsQ
MRSVGARSTKANKARNRSRTKQSPRKPPPRAAVANKAAGRREPKRDGRIVRFFRYLGGLPVIRRPMLSLTLILLVAGAGAGLFAGGYISDTLSDLRARTLAMFTAVGFTIEEITLDGNERTSAESVYGALGIETGISIFDAEPDALRARLTELPWVADAEVRRVYPDRVAVRLIEKRPFAYWQIGSSLVLVERSGAVIDGVEPDPAQTLPLLIGPGAPDVAASLVDILDGQRAVNARLQAAERISERRWDLILDRGIRVRLPEIGWEAQVVELERLIVDQGVLERDLEIIDLRFPDSYIFQLHNGDSQPVSRETPV